jgi:hypothetical protein
VSLPAGFTPADRIVVVAIRTRLEISSDNPVCSASAITGTRPAYDTKCGSSKIGVARDQP